ncbi:beta-galactosidase [Tessaracoccus sp.]
MESHRLVGTQYEGWLVGVTSICHGGDYSPEQWPETVWAEDVRLMREAGVNMVSIGMFSWALLEPREGEYDFAWLDRLIDLLHSHGIRVDLATPTAAPPAWFFHAYPDSRVVTRTGTALGFGSRGMVSPSSPDFRRASVNIASRLAERYGSHPALALWHVHNEYGAPVAEDYSAHSAIAFRQWLRKRHGSIGALNEAWGTCFWGQVYGEWEHVGVPAASPSVVNPSQCLDFARFTNDSLLACFTAERDAIRIHSKIPITTNFMAGNCDATDLWAWAREVDIVSNDHYLTAADPRGEVGLALAADLTRSVAGGKPWLLLEHSPSGVNWQPRNVAKRPGEMARSAFSHLGRGADAIMFFQWRASRSGAEKFHAAMLPHAGTSSRVWREVVELGTHLGALSPLLGSRVQADVALLWDQESIWAQGLDWRPSVDASARERINSFYDRFWRDGVTVDFAHPLQDLSGYRLVIAPASYLLTADGAANLTRFVEAGGTLLVSFFSGIVDENDTVHPGGFGAPLERVLGLTIDEFLPLREGEHLRVALSGKITTSNPNETVTATVWADDIAIKGATVLGTYIDGPLPGAPAVTRNALGAGTAWYLSTCVDVDTLSTLLSPIYEDAGLKPTGLPEGFEVVHRRGVDADYIIAINHRNESHTVPCPAVGTTELLTGTEISDACVIPAGDVRVFQLPHSAG